jgi:hypothetical protein
MARMLLLLGSFVGLLACGKGTPPDCKTLADVTGRDTCRLASLELIRSEHPRSALELARTLEQPQVRDATVLTLLTSSRAFADAEVRQICKEELASTASQDQCTSWLSRPHLRVIPESAPATDKAAPIGEDSTECGNEPAQAQDDCYHRAALVSGGSAPNQAASALSRIQDPRRRGQAVAGVLRNFQQPGSLNQLLALQPLLALASGKWRAESTSLLGSHLPFQVLQACDRTAGGTCDSAVVSSLLTFSIETCEGADRLGKQCFSHICSGLVERTMIQSRGATAGDWALAMESLALDAQALDPRLTRRSCQPIWAGRKLIQHGRADTAWAAERCIALNEGTDACLSGAAEEFLVTWLRSENLTNPALFGARAVESDRGPFKDVAADLRPFLPCGAFHVLNQELNSGLSGGKAGEVLLKQLQSASPRCVWKDEKLITSQ